MHSAKQVPKERAVSVEAGAVSEEELERGIRGRGSRDFGQMSPRAVPITRVHHRGRGAPRRAP